jgi:hypothetical protein
MSESPREKGEAIDEVLVKRKTASRLAFDGDFQSDFGNQPGINFRRTNRRYELLGQLVGEQIDLARMKHELQNFELMEN